MMRRITLSLLAATAVGLVISQGASAADMGMPVKAAPVAPPVPLFNWTGVYAGGFFGVGVSRNQFSSPSATTATFEGACEGSSTFGPPFASPCAGGAGNLGSHTGVGPLGGFTLGYRFQAPQSPIVWGIEGQFAFADIKGSHGIGSSATTEGFCGNIGDGAPCLNNTIRNSLISSQIKDIATIAGTFGITSGPQDRTLWFVKGGGAWAKTQYSQADNISSTSHFNFGISEGFGTTINSFTSANTSRWGWMVGTGVEWGLWGNWSAKIEYDFLDFGNHDVTLTGTENHVTVNSCCDGSSAFSQTLHVNQQIHMVQVGLNYKFDWGGGKGVWH
jgi:outer membrane immunogenic protein